MTVRFPIETKRGQMEAEAFVRWFGYPPQPSNIEEVGVLVTEPMIVTEAMLDEVREEAWPLLLEKKARQEEDDAW